MGPSQCKEKVKYNHGRLYLGPVVSNYILGVKKFTLRTNRNTGTVTTGQSYAWKMQNPSSLAITASDHEITPDCYHCLISDIR